MPPAAHGQSPNCTNLTFPAVERKEEEVYTISTKTLINPCRFQATDHVIQAKIVATDACFSKKPCQVAQLSEMNKMALLVLKSVNNTIDDREISIPHIPFAENLCKHTHTVLYEICLFQEFGKD